MLLLPTAVMMASVWTSETTTKINSFVFLLLTSFSLCIFPSVLLLYLHLYRIFLSHPCNTLNKSFPPLKLRPVSRNVEIWQRCDVVSYPRERNSQLHCCETSNTQVSLFLMMTLVRITHRPHFTPGKDPVPILQKAGWAPGPVWTGGKCSLHWHSIPDRPARSQSLYWLSYPALKHNVSILKEVLNV
jgi:hypothetical protein